MPVTLTWADDIATLTIDRPERRNALSIDLWHALRDAARACTQARAVIVTGASGHFCSGMDLSPDNPVVGRIAPSILEGEEYPAFQLLKELKDCVAALTEIPCPTFAAIEGACIGGGLEVALACDVRIAAKNATIGLTEVRTGMIPDLGGCVRLTRLVGPGRAADLITTGRKVNGEEAFRLGFVERLAEPGEAFNQARAAALEVAKNAPTAVQLALNVVRMAPDLGVAEALSLETRAGVMALISGEAREGISAFLEKRSPDWKVVSQG